jgi:hypothetical protein
MFSASEDSLRQSRCVFILRVSLTVSQCHNQRKSPALAVLVAVCLGEDMIYARAYCFQKCVGDEGREFKHRRYRAGAHGAEHSAVLARLR